MRKKNKILFITSHYGKPKTGGHLYNFYIIKILEKMEYSVRIHSEYDIPKVFRKNIFMLNIWYPINCHNLNADVLFIDSRLHTRLFIFLFLNKIIFKPKIIGTVHHLTYPTRNNFIFSFIEKHIEKYFIGFYDTIITPSYFSKTSVKQLIDNKKNIITINPWIENKSTNYIINRKFKKKQLVKLLFVCSIEKRKGLIHLIKAFQYVKYKNIYLQIVGSTETESVYYNNMLILINRLNMKNMVCFLGNVSKKKLNTLYSESDIFIFPTLFEGFGIVIAEAMKHGLPIIASNITSIPELVKNNINGILVPPTNSFLLAKAIDMLSFNPQLRKKMGGESRFLAQKINTKKDFMDKITLLFHQELSLYK